jgi:hypothetical protein
VNVIGLFVMNLSVLDCSEVKRELESSHIYLQQEDVWSELPPQNEGQSAMNKGTNRFFL